MNNEFSFTTANVLSVGCQALILIFLVIFMCEKSFFSATSSPEVGNEIYAAGFPLGNPEFTLLDGIVTKKEADGDTPWSSIESTFEHNAEIKSGNSGGPVVGKSDFKVYGVNYATDSENQEFAINNDIASKLINSMIAGTNKLGFGINGEQIEGVGLLLSSVDLGSPLDKAGVIGGDLIITLDGIDLTVAPTLKTYCDILATKTSRGQVSIEVFRLQDLNIYSGVLNSGTKISTSDNFESSSSPTTTTTSSASQAPGNTQATTTTSTTTTTLPPTTTTTSTTTTTLPPTTTTTLPDTTGPVLTGFTVEPGSGNTSKAFNAKLTWNPASDESGISSYTMTCSKSANLKPAKTVSKDFTNGNYFWIWNPSDGNSFPSSEMDNFWIGDHNFSQTCTLTVYDTLLNASTASVSWQTELVPMQNFLSGIRWIGPDAICMDAGNRVSSYLIVRADIYANGVLRNTQNDITASALFNNLSADTTYTLSIIFTDQYGRSETITYGVSIVTNNTEFYWWERNYSSYSYPPPCGP